MATLKLQGRELKLGELTGAHLEDNYDAVVCFSSITGMPTKEQFSAMLDLAALAAAAGGESLTRAELAALVRLPDAAAVVKAVSVSLGFVEVSTDTGEAKGPATSPI